MRFEKVNDMKYEIGDIVKHPSNKLGSFIVLATSSQNLNMEYLKSKTGIFHIQDFKHLAKKNVNVQPGFDYKIALSKSSQNGLAVLDGVLLDVFEGDISR